MKKKIIFTCLFFFISGLSNQLLAEKNVTREEFLEIVRQKLDGRPEDDSTQENLSFIFSIQFPKAVTPLPDIRVYYKGNKIESLDSAAIIEKNQKLDASSPRNNSQDFVFVERADIGSFDVFIANKFIPYSQDKTTISCLAIPEETAFIATKATKIITEENKNVPTEKEGRSISWEIVPDKKDKTSVLIQKHQAPTLVPDNAIIIFMDASLVEEFLPGTQIKEGHAHILPRIVIKKSVQEKQIRDSSIEALLNSIDVGIFHARVETAKKIINGTVLKSPQ